MACVNQKEKNNIGSGGASSMSNFFVKNKKKIMTRKGDKGVWSLSPNLITA